MSISTRKLNKSTIIANTVKDLADFLGDSGDTKNALIINKALEVMDEAILNLTQDVIDERSDFKTNYNRTIAPPTSGEKSPHFFKEKAIIQRMIKKIQDVNHLVYLPPQAGIKR